MSFLGSLNLIELKFCLLPGDQIIQLQSLSVMYSDGVVRIGAGYSSGLVTYLSVQSIQHNWMV